MEIKTSWIVGGVVLLLALTGGLFWLSAPRDVPVSDEPPAKKVAPTPVAEAQPAACVPKDKYEVSADDFTIGDAKAPVTIVEFFSQTCSHCAAFHAEVFPQLNDKYIKTGLARLVLRDFQRNKVDLVASVIGRCMGRGSFIKFTDALLEQQSVWMGRPDQDVRQGLKDVALQMGMKADAFEACMQKEDEAKRLLDATIKAKNDYCIEGTPTLLINGKKVADAPSVEEFLGMIDAEVKALSAKDAAAPKP